MARGGRVVVGCVQQGGEYVQWLWLEPLLCGDRGAMEGSNGETWTGVGMKKSSDEEQ